MKTVIFEMTQTTAESPKVSGRYFAKLDDGSYDFRWFAVTDFGNVWTQANEPLRREVVAWSKAAPSVVTGNN